MRPQLGTENTAEEQRTIALPNHLAKAQLWYPCQLQQGRCQLFSKLLRYSADTSIKQKGLIEEKLLMAKNMDGLKIKKKKKKDLEM